MNFGYLLLGLVIIVISTVLHELTHGVVAYWLGDTTAEEEGRLSLNPLKHIDPVMSILVPVMMFLMNGPIFGGAKPVPVDSRNLKFREWGMALVALAGPLTNFLLAFVAFLVGHFTGALYGTGIGTDIVSYTVLINLGLMLFNLIPFPPLDGSRVLYALAPDGVRRGMEYLETYGTWIVLLLVWVLSRYVSAYIVWGRNGILDFFFWVVGG